MLVRKPLVRRTILLAGLTVLAACGESLVDQPTGGSSDTITQSSQPAARYIIEVKNAAGRSAVEQAGSVKVDLSWLGAVAAELPQAAVSALQNNPNIGDIEVDPKRRIVAETIPYGINMIGASGYTHDPTDDLAKKVCIIDSGYTPGHPDLPAATAISLDHRYIGGDDTDWDSDTCGHGTHVAGTIAAVAGNDEGVVGVAQSANLLIAKVFGKNVDDPASDPCGWIYASDTLAAAKECALQEADIINMSLGGSFKSRTEERGFDQLAAQGVLAIAAAGNDGNRRRSYPASYPGVVSVAAVDSNSQVASFSQQNADVEIAAPGVGVLSTLPWASDLTVNDETVLGDVLDNAPTTPVDSISGALLDGGLCDTNDVPTNSGAIVLCERGEFDFLSKVNNAAAAGAAAVAIYNNEPGGFGGTCGDTPCDVPAISISQADGQALVANSLGDTGELKAGHPSPGYAAWNGTSMATPHVAGAAALVWSMFPDLTNSEVRALLNDTADHPSGADIRDDSYGHGIVNVDAAITQLGGPACTADTDCATDEYCDQGTCLTLCGNGVCDASEDYTTCLTDCPECTDTDTTNCNTDEYCSGGICEPLCGDDICDATIGEDYTSCPADCDECAVDTDCAAGEYCDAGSCEPLCGNGTCDDGETADNCSSDCGVQCVADDGSCHDDADCCSGACTRGKPSGRVCYTP